MDDDDDDTSNPHKRVILLLDMDCFYAQCEMVRLGIPRDIPVALLQWSSALAVNYPARDRFDIKRGDSFEVIRDKSKGECVAIHLPVTPVLEAGGMGDQNGGKLGVDEELRDMEAGEEEEETKTNEEMEDGHNLTGEEGDIAGSGKANPPRLPLRRRCRRHHPRSKSPTTRNSIGRNMFENKCTKWRRIR